MKQKVKYLSTLLVVFIEMFFHEISCGCGASTDIGFDSFELIRVEYFSAAMHCDSQIMNADRPIGCFWYCVFVKTLVFKTVWNKSWSWSAYSVIWC